LSLQPKGEVLEFGKISQSLHSIEMTIQNNSENSKRLFQPLSQPKYSSHVKYHKKQNHNHFQTLSTMNNQFINEERKNIAQILSL
jgi:hypothetical protein